MFYLKIFFISLFCLFFASAFFAKEKISDEIIIEWIKQLGDESYKVREKAIKNLTNLPDVNRKIIVNELKLCKNLEVQDRLKNILKLSEFRIIELFGELYLKGNQFYKEKKYQEALKELEKILEIEPEYVMAFELKAKILFEIEEFKEFEIVSNKLLTFEEKSAQEKAEINFNLSRVYLISGEYEKSVFILEKLLTQTDESKPVLNLLCTAYEMNKQFNKAEEILLNEIKVNPSNAHATSAIAWFYIRNGQQDKAKIYLETFFNQIKEFEITSVLNYLFLGQNQIGYEKIKTLTNSIQNEFKDKKLITFDEFSPMNSLYFCYQYYFEKSINMNTSIDFKKIYNAFSENDKKIWPIPLLGLYAGELTFEKLNSQLLSPNKTEMRNNKCEAYFYYGLLKLTENNNNEAKKYFQLSKDLRVYEYVETTAASYMLQKLK